MFSKKVIKRLMLATVGVLVAAVFLAGSLPSLPSMYQIGTSLPGTCTISQLFFKTDNTAGSNIYGCTATNVWALQTGGASTVVSTPPYLTYDGGTSYYGPVWNMGRPTDAGTWVQRNFAGVTLTTVNGAYYYNFPAGTGNNRRGHYVPLPAGTSYTLRIAYTITSPAIANQYCGVGLYETATTKSVILGSIANSNIAIVQFLDDTTPNGAPYQVAWGTNVVEGKVIWVNIVRSGTTLTYYRGPVPEITGNWQVYQSNVNTYFTTAPDAGGLFCSVDNGSSNAVNMSMLSYQVL